MKRGEHDNGSIRNNYFSSSVFHSSIGYSSRYWFFSLIFYLVVPLTYAQDWTITWVADMGAGPGPVWIQIPSGFVDSIEDLTDGTPSNICTESYLLAVLRFKFALDLSQWYASQGKTLPYLYQFFCENSSPAALGYPETGLHFIGWKGKYLAIEFSSGTGGCYTPAVLMPGSYSEPESMTLSGIWTWTPASKVRFIGCGNGAPTAVFRFSEYFSDWEKYCLGSGTNASNDEQDLYYSHGNQLDLGPGYVTSSQPQGTSQNTITGALTNITGTFVNNQVTGEKDSYIYNLAIQTNGNCNYMRVSDAVTCPEPYKSGNGANNTDGKKWELVTGGEYKIWCASKNAQNIVCYINYPNSVYMYILQRQEGDSMLKRIVLLDQNNRECDSFTYTNPEGLYAGSAPNFNVKIKTAPYKVQDLAASTGLKAMNLNSAENAQIIDKLQTISDKPLTFESGDLETGVKNGVAGLTYVAGDISAENLEILSELQGMRSMELDGIHTGIDDLNIQTGSALGYLEGIFNKPNVDVSGIESRLDTGNGNTSEMNSKQDLTNEKLDGIRSKLDDMSTGPDTSNLTANSKIGINGVEDALNNNGLSTISSGLSSVGMINIYSGLNSLSSGENETFSVSLPWPAILGTPDIGTKFTYSDSKIHWEFKPSDYPVFLQICSGIKMLATFMIILWAIPHVWKPWSPEGA